MNCTVQQRHRIVVSSQAKVQRGTLQQCECDAGLSGVMCSEGEAVCSKAKALYGFITQS